MPTIKFITLTLRHTNDPLKDQVSRLKNAFRRLRQRVLWRKVKWGAAVIEIKRNPNSGEWHPHLHILVDAKFIPQEQLSSAWLAVTGDSSIVDIRAVKDRRAAVNEIAKYASKPCSFQNLRDSLLAGATLYEAIDGRRLLIIFGDWPKHMDRSKMEDSLPDDWVPVQPLADCLREAKAGDPHALERLRQCNIPPKVLKGWLKAIPPPD